MHKIRSTSEIEGKLVKLVLGSEDLSCVRDPLSKFMVRQPPGQFQIGKLRTWSVSNAMVGKITGEWNGQTTIHDYSFNKTWGGGIRPGLEIASRVETRV